jgi:hypothetical protein
MDLPQLRFELDRYPPACGKDFYCLPDPLKITAIKVLEALAREMPGPPSSLSSSLGA